MKKTQRLAAVAALSALALTACTSTGGNESGTDVRVVAFSVMENANEPVFEDFKATDAGADVNFVPSYGPSGDQSRSVVNGADADVVHFSLETDVTRLVDAGLVDQNWKDTPTNGIATSSVVVFVVRKGNPENIQGWDDLVKPGIEVVTPNPGSSGSARWNILAAWAHVAGNGGTEEQAKTFVSDLLANTPALPASARDATSAFEEGDQDVLLSYENEAVIAKQNGVDVDYIVPDDTLLIENPAAVTTEASDAGKAFLEFMTSPEAQADYAQAGFRPVIDGVDFGDVEGANDPTDPFPVPPTLFTIDDTFNGWGEAADTFFADGEDGGPVGIITQLIADSGSDAQE
ncbi:sulfate ABC transporter substrate-binding protein [Nocardioides sp.]|uniref:sulfate ABC transporter substrate-binding protein n=1 Tax=Nocardioides sp. TaxID=35761 RepID=UPI0035139935